MQPVLQVALDFADLDRALQLAAEAIAGGADWVEAGTPLIKSVGLDCVRELRRAFPQAVIVADMKTMDAGYAEVEMAAKAGANIVVAVAAAADSTLRECAQAAAAYNACAAADLLGVANPVERARQIQDFGLSHVGFHTPIDEQMRGETPFASLRALCQAVAIPVAVAGGVNSQTAPLAVEAGASIVIVGGAITKAPNARQATQAIKQAIAGRAAVQTSRFTRVAGGDLRPLLLQTPTADLSTGNHDWPGFIGFRQITPGVAMAGTAFTVRTLPGDWSKPVQAIDHAKPGDVLVIDAGGQPPAIWGELATLSAKQRGLAGIVIHGAARDTGAIRRAEFPVYATLVCPHAGKPKGYGELGPTLNIHGQTIRPGDWIVGDDDGLIVLPAERAVEMANRSRDKLEGEERIIQEINNGKTLGQIIELAKWDVAH